MTSKKMTINNIDIMIVSEEPKINPHYEKVHKFYSPEEFKSLYNVCLKLGFKMISSSPMTRSSYHADEDFEKLKKVV